MPNYSVTAVDNAITADQTVINEVLMKIVSSVNVEEDLTDLHEEDARKLMELLSNVSDIYILRDGMV
jgi:hypothetical protein